MTWSCYHVCSQKKMPTERMRMRPWLEEQINSCQIPGLKWVNKVKCTQRVMIDIVDDDHQIIKKYIIVSLSLFVVESHGHFAEYKSFTKTELLC